jgi:putative transposase
MPRLRHYDHLNTARFVTFSCYRRHKLLVNEPVVRVFLEMLQGIRQQYRIEVLGYVVMPEHVHLVLHPPDGLRLGPIIGELKAKSASRILSGKLVQLPGDCTQMKDGRCRRFFWQPRCYDHNCRTPETVIEKINYCHNNPVKRGLVGQPAEWDWSSYNWYTGKRDVPLAMDEVGDVICE